MILLRQKTYTSGPRIHPSFRPSEEYIQKEIEMGKKGYGVLPRQFEGRKKDFVYFTNGKDTVGYNIWTCEEHRPDTKNFSNIGFRIRKARATYRDVLDAHKDPKFAENRKKEAEEFLKNAAEQTKFDDKNRQIVYPGGYTASFKDELRYNVAKEQQLRASKAVLKNAQEYYNSANSNKTPKQEARKEALKTLVSRQYSETKRRPLISPERKEKIRENIKRAAIQNSMSRNDTMDTAVHIATMQQTGIM